MTTATRIQQTLGKNAETFMANGVIADQQEQFSKQNYQLLSEAKIFSAMVPEQFGGGGMAYRDMCNSLRLLASYHPSTALACSMHQHIVAANRYNHEHGRPGQALLEKVAARELILISTGAGDWLASSGEMRKTEGGFILNASKHFASGSPVGNVLVTSAPYEDPEEGWQVLHFPVATSAEGVTVLDNWHPMGMRGSGSNSVILKDVLVPEATIAVRRPRGDFHTMWCTILPVALPLIMSVYCGVAETAAQRARERCNASKDPVTPYLLGEMENALTIAQMGLREMIGIVDEFTFTGDINTVNEIVKRKTIVAAGCKQTCAKALEACGGPGYLQASGIESLLRDVMAAHFHPMQEKRQLLFSGSLSMGQQPPSQAF